jgi:hypothetical protein
MTAGGGARGSSVKLLLSMAVSLALTRVTIWACAPAAKDSAAALISTAAQVSLKQA